VKDIQKGKNVKVLSFKLFNNKDSKTIAVLFADTILRILPGCIEFYYVIIISGSAHFPQ
jgi:hypothetical protein